MSPWMVGNIIWSVGILVWAAWAWRSSRSDAPKKPKGDLRKRVINLEKAMAELPSAENLAEIVEKGAAPTPMQLKVLVDRVNQVSADAIALKEAHEKTMKELETLKQTMKWAGITQKKAGSGG